MRSTILRALIALSTMFVIGSAYGQNKVVVIPLFGDDAASKWRGEWQDNTQYKTGEIVEFNGSSYIALEDHLAQTSTIPSLKEEWDIVAASGSNGINGAQGLKGDTGERGLQGETGEQGAKGEAGEQGPKGDTGMQGPKGDTGEQGPAGLAAFNLTRRSNLNPGQNRTTRINCGAGEIAISCGTFKNNASEEDSMGCHVEASLQSCLFYHDENSSSDGGLQAHCMCLALPTS